VVTLEDVDPTTPFVAQLQESAAPVVLMNKFVVPEGGHDEVLAAWEKDAAYMKAQPGFISTQLHRGTGSSRVLVNVAVWESTDALRAAFGSAAFQQALANYPDGTVARPHLVQRIAVGNICVA
jgi:heme-degrading monooxygenase HmoA